MVAELESLLAAVQDGSPLTAETFGRIQIWKANLRSKKAMLRYKEIPSFTATERLAMALENMTVAWDSFEKAATAKTQERLNGSTSTHATSIKLMRLSRRNL